jgi:hypothetical protein
VSFFGTIFRTVPHEFIRHAIDRRRIEPTPKKTSESTRPEKGDIRYFFDCPVGMVGESVVVEVQYRRVEMSNPTNVYCVKEPGVDRALAV